MSRETERPGERKTRRAIVKLLKTEGPLDSARLAERLGLTTMAVRQHLYALQSENLVAHEERPVPLGRPTRFWSLRPSSPSSGPWSPDGFSARGTS